MNNMGIKLNRFFLNCGLISLRRYNISQKVFILLIKMDHALSQADTLKKSLFENKKHRLNICQDSHNCHFRVGGGAKIWKTVLT